MSSEYAWVNRDTDANAGRRGWQVVKKDVDDLKAVKDARSVSFVDMDEDVSTLDLEKGEWNG